MKGAASAVLLAAVLVLAGHACLISKVTNPSFCCVTNCEQHGASGPVACESPLVCDADHFNCVDPSNGGTCNTPDECPTVTPFCDLTTHQCKQCLGTMGCTPAAPVCAASEACSACTGEGDCAGYVATHLGHCATTGPDTGQCVQCRDGADCATTTPVCDASACRACRTDDECPSKACDEVSGACAPMANVIYMAPTGSGSACTMAQPCGTFAEALGQVSGNRDIIKMAAGSYVERVSISDQNLEIHGDGADLSASTAGQLVTVIGQSSVSIKGLRIHDALGATGDGVHCNDNNGNSPSVSLTRVSVDHNGGVGVNASKCGISVKQSRVLHNTAGGIVANNGPFTIENDFISGNGTTSSIAGGVSIQSITTGGTHVFQFNSVSSNVSSNAANSGVDCVLDTTSLKLASSIVYGNVGGTSKQVGGANCAWTYSDLGDGTTGTGNINTDPMFQNASQDDLHLMSGSLAKNAADPASTLTIDIDGDTRPQGGAPDMGADEIAP